MSLEPDQIRRSIRHNAAVAPRLYRQPLHRIVAVLRLTRVLVKYATALETTTTILDEAAYQPCTQIDATQSST